MLVYRNSSAIRGASAQVPEVAPLLAKRIEELEQYAEDDLGSLVNVLVVQPKDALAEVEAELGFHIDQRTPEIIESHPGWYELTYVLGDDGFGLVLYVPKSADIDPLLRELCAPTTPGANP